MTQILLISVLILLLMIFILYKLDKIIEYVQQNGLGLTNLYNIWGVVRLLNQKLYNARKRDENLLREIHKIGKENVMMFNEIDPRERIKEIIKKISGVNNVCRENSNLTKESKTLILSTVKSLKEIKPILENSSQSLKSCTKTLGLFEEIIKKSNIQDAERISKRSGR